MSQTEDECRHLIFPPSACTICNPKPKVKIKYEPVRDFRAKFPGFCPVCKTHFQENEVLRMWAEGDEHDAYFTYTHQECDPNADHL